MGRWTTGALALCLALGAQMRANAQPANDTCAAATPIVAGEVVMGSTIGAAFSNTGFCGTSHTAADVWFSYAAAEDGLLTLSTCG
ncbi:MAG: hypothetical protein AAGH15_16285, partial [Myxococcota bacterium]